MKLFIFNSRENYRSKDLTRLDAATAKFIETESTPLESVPDLYAEEDFVLGVHPNYIEDAWEGFTWERLKPMKSLRGISLSTTAYGWVPFNELATRRIPVTNVPNKSTVAVAEYDIMIMLTLLRKLPQVINNDWKFAYNHDQIGTEAKGLTVGIIGLGNIGRRLADLCAAFGMKVIYYSRSPKVSNYTSFSLDEVCQKSDVIFITTVADESTRNLIGKHQIDLMKPTAIIVTPVDPIVYDKDYILKLVAEEKLGGFGYESESEKMGHHKGNVFTAPEIAYYTEQTLENESRIMTDSMLSILEGNPKNVVNR